MLEWAHIYLKDRLYNAQAILCLRPWLAIWGCYKSGIVINLCCNFYHTGLGIEFFSCVLMVMDCRLPKSPLIVATKCKPLTDKITNYSNASNYFPSGFKSFFMGFLIPLDVVCIHLASKTNRSVSASSLLMIFKQVFLIHLQFSCVF